MLTTPERPRPDEGFDARRVQFTLQLLQVFFVGLTIGMTRVVVPALGEQEFHLGRDSFALLAGFVVAFGAVKAVMNLLAGRLAERIGRRPVLILGWLAAIPIPLLIFYAPTWNWVIAATILLGINQGLTWTMTITSKLDLARPDQRGLANGLNEFSGYLAVALAAAATSRLAEKIGSRRAILVFGLAVIGAAVVTAVLAVRETRPAPAGLPEAPAGPVTPGTSDIPHPTHIPFFALCQAGLIEKFADALFWLLPPFFLASGLDLSQTGLVVAVYGATWGTAQLATGPLSDRIGRRAPIVTGMLACGAGVGLILAGRGLAWWCACAALSGLGMALLYPTLGAAVADLAPAARRAAALGLYRFWRDLGYAAGALALGLLVQHSPGFRGAILFVCIAMISSGLLAGALLPSVRPAPTR